MSAIWQVGIYVSPFAITGNAEYARRLVLEKGVSEFVIRTGFDPAAESSNLESAVKIVKDLNASVCFLVGTWWGHIETPPLHRSEKSNESRFPMTYPGSATDDVISEKLRSLSITYSPDEICLTHARYRHPAYISGVFDTGDKAYQYRMEKSGIHPAMLQESLKLFESALAHMKPEDIKVAAEKGLINFLCDISQNDLFSRFFAFRCDTILEAAKKFRNVVKNCSDHILFGTNAFSTEASEICGQDYHRLGNAYDFVQPLLGYMEWHTVESIASWARFLLQKHPAISETEAIDISKRLFQLKDAFLPSSLGEMDQFGEGTEQSILSVTSTQIKNSAKYIGNGYALLPVLRGRTWPRTVIASLIAELNQYDFDGLIFQGTDYLLTPVPEDGWY